jgi:hypothetical protein
MAVMSNKKSGKKKLVRGLLSKALRCKLNHSLLMGYPIIESDRDKNLSLYECSYCGRTWKGKFKEKYKERGSPFYRFLRG